jgi:hypothetical protein
VESSFDMDINGFNLITAELELEIRKHKRINKAYTKVGYGPWSGSAEGEDVKAGLTKVAIAVWQEYGTERGIPPRPFMHQCFDKRINMIEKVSANLHAQYLNGKLTEKQALARLGEWYAGEIKDEILSGDFKPLAASTIRKKGSTRPLVDTGLNLLGGVDHKEVL